VVVGNSDAPAYVTGDRVIVNLAAYDFKLPYIDKIIKHLKKPSAGDYVLFRHNDGTLMFKRIVAVPGNMIEMIDNRLIINGKHLQYQKIDTPKAIELPFRTQLGSVIERETGNGDDIFISYTQGASSSSTFAQEKLPEDMYFVLGSNRDNSTDSRHSGYVPRNKILGKVVGKF
jgi:signal peptidase I